MTPRIAIACSGLGRVARGNETWAATLAEGLHKSGGNAILFGSGPRAEARSPYVRVPCFNRNGWLRKFISWDKAYLWEQITFARNLRRHLRPDRFDIIHVADPNLAQQLIAHARKNSMALIYKDGLFIGPEWCAKFEHVQVLAPYYLEAAHAQNRNTQGWRVIPHAVDTKAFAPARIKAPSAPVVLAVGDFSERGQKRMDWIIQETAKAKSKPKLLLVGHATASELEKVRALAEAKLPGLFEIRTGLDHRAMPALFQSADLFAHAATREPFGLVFIEAMACGLPAIGHDFEVTRWIIGDGGSVIDMTRENALASEIDQLLSNPEKRAALGMAARSRVENAFSREAILPHYHAWHREIAAGRK
jgi:glycosyltransferase involved in cell wall biosynthesis